MTQNFKAKPINKKTLFLTHVGDPGGAEYVMIRLCEPIKDTAEILHFQPGTLEEILKKQNITASICPMPPDMANFKRENGLWPLIKAIPATLSMIRNIARKCKDFDTIICMSQKSFILTALAKPFIRKPVIWFMNDLISPEHFSRPLIFLLTKVFALGADIIVLNSEASLKAWKASGGSTKKTRLIYPGTDTELIQSQITDQETINTYKKTFSPDGKPLIGIFGRISPWKGQNVFLKAIAATPDVNAVIVGDALFGEEEYHASLKKLIKTLKIEQRVTFAGHLGDVPKAMAACDIVAHCSTAPEPFGLVIVEAMLSGSAVIASDAGGAQEIVLHNETGQLTSIKDSTALAEAFQNYLNDPKWTKEITESASKRAKTHFSNDMMIKDFLEILEEKF